MLLGECVKVGEFALVTIFFLLGFLQQPCLPWKKYSMGVVKMKRRKLLWGWLFFSREVGWVVVFSLVGVED